jgi:hypothetical protein
VDPPAEPGAAGGFPSWAEMVIILLLLAKIPELKRPKSSEKTTHLV